MMLREKSLRYEFERQEAARLEKMFILECALCLYDAI